MPAAASPPTPTGLPAPIARATAPLVVRGEEGGFFEEDDFLDGQDSRLPVAYGGWAQPVRAVPIEFAVPSGGRRDRSQDARYREAVTPHDLSPVGHDSDTAFSMPVPILGGRPPTPAQRAAAEKETELEFRSPRPLGSGGRSVHDADTAVGMPVPRFDVSRSDAETAMEIQIPSLDGGLPDDYRETGADFAAPRLDDIDDDMRATGVDFAVPDIDDIPDDEKETGAELAVPKIQPLPDDERETGYDFLVPEIEPPRPRARHAKRRNSSAREFRSFDELLD